MRSAKDLMAQFVKVDQGMEEVSDWGKEIMALPSMVDEILRKGSIYENQCVLFKSLVYSVAQYAGVWIYSFSQVMELVQTAGAGGKELLRVLKRGIKIIGQLQTEKASSGVLLIILGSFGQFAEIVDDVRRYCEMINRIIFQFLPYIPYLSKVAGFSYRGESQRDQAELMDQMKCKVDVDCKALQAFLTWGYNEDRLALLKNLYSSNYGSLGNLSKHYVLNGLIPMLETGVFPPKTCIESKDLSCLDELGSGAFGNVSKELWCNNHVAVKEFKESEPSSFGREFEVFSKVAATDSSHIVQLLGHCERKKTVNDDPETRKCLVLELMSEDLRSFIGTDKMKPLVKTVDIILQIAKGMKHLHDSDVIYRDMKPANILFKETEDGSFLVKLADFGVSKVNFETGAHTKMQGTMVYMAPEMLKGEEQYSRKADVFSFGMVCSQILTGQKNLGSVRGKPQVTEIRRELKQKLLEMDIHVGLKTLIASCWNEEHDQRPTFADICDKLWLIKGDLLFVAPMLSLVHLQ